MKPLQAEGFRNNEIERGMVLADPGAIAPHAQFIARTYILTAKEGGRHKPFFPGYRPQFYVRTTDVTGTIRSLMSEAGGVLEMLD